VEEFLRTVVQRILSQHGSASQMKVEISV